MVRTDTVGDSVIFDNGTNVGIGTTAPGYNLHIADTDATINLAKTDGDQYLRLVGGSGTNSDVIAQRTLTLQALSGNVLLQPTGNVGIGTTNPTTNLQLGSFGTADQEFRIESSGNSYFSVLTTNGVQKIYAGGAGTQSNEIAFYTSNSGAEGEAMRIDTSGNVGIGTTSPSSPLDVATISSGPVAKFVNTSGTGGAGVVIQAGVATSSSILTLFDYQNNERLRVRGDGNVGIGTTSPGSKLHVSSVSSNSQLTLERTGTFTGKYTMHTASNNFYIGNSVARTYPLTILNSGNVGIGTTSPETLLHLDSSVDAASGLTLGYVNSADRSLRVFFVNATGGNSIYRDADSLRFATGASAGSSSGVTKMLLTDAGNVGIGTTSPGTKLEIGGSSEPGIRLRETGGSNYYDIKTNGSIAWFGDQANGMKNLVVTAGGGAEIRTNGDLVAFKVENIAPAGSLYIKGTTGNVGIGTTSPGAKLDVNGNVAINYTGGASASNQISMVGSRASFGYDGSISSAFMRSSDTSKPLVFGSGASELMRIVSSTGNVGIGTSSPSQKLEVDGQVLSDGYRLAAMQTAPAARNSTGTLGEIVIDGNHIYVCYATDSWSRVALDTSW